MSNQNNVENEPFNLQHLENRNNKNQASRQQQKANPKQREEHVPGLPSLQSLTGSGQKGGQNSIFSNPLSSDLGAIPNLKESGNYTIKANENTGSLRVSPTGPKPEDSKLPHNERTSKDDSVLLEKNSINEGSKINKNSAQPIVLKHDPQVLQQKDDLSKLESLSSGSKSQPKSAFKLAHKLHRGDEEDLGPQKKVKTDIISSANNNDSPNNNEMQDSGSKKISSSIITPSASKN